MDGPIRDLERLIDDELCQHPWPVAQRMLTKALAALHTRDPALERALRERLNRALAAAPPVRGAAVAPAPEAPPRRRQALWDDPGWIERLAADALHAPTDGSEARYRVLCERARQQLAAALEGQALRAWRRWRLRRQLEAALARHRADGVPPRGPGRT